MYVYRLPSDFFIWKHQKDFCVKISIRYSIAVLKFIKSLRVFKLRGFAIFEIKSTKLFREICLNFLCKAYLSKFTLSIKNTVRQL